MTLFFFLIEEILIFTIKKNQTFWFLWFFHQFGQQRAFIFTFNQSFVECWDHADAKCHE